jgi:hypothetical protein
MIRKNIKIKLFKDNLFKKINLLKTFLKKKGYFSFLKKNKENDIIKF